MLGCRGSLRLMVVVAGLFLIGLAAGACGAAEQPTATPTRPPVVAATPTTAPTAAPTTVPAVVATPTRAATATPTPAGVQPKYGGVATFAHRADPARWDIMAYSSLNLTLFIGPIWGNGNLTKECREDNFQVCPGLATRWEPNADFTQWTFTVRDGVLWHDGTLLTAEDVKWYIDLTINGVKGPKTRPPSLSAAYLDSVEKVEVVGTNQVRFNLKQSQGLFPTILSVRNLEIMHPRHLMQPQIDKGNVTVAPNEVGYVGMGPFKYEKWDKGSVFQVRRFDRYWEKDKQGRQLPYLDGVNYPIMTEASTIFAAFRAGRLDRTAVGTPYYTTPGQRETLNREFGDKVALRTYPGFGKLMGLNARRAPFNDARVRQAVSLSLDRQSYIDAIENGDGDIVGVWTADSPYANPDYLTWPGWNQKTKEQDRKRAKELLAEAGYPNGFKLKIMTGTQYLNYSEWAQAQLVGLLGQGNVELDVVDWVVFLKRLCDGDFAVANPLDSGVDARFSPEILASGYITTNKCSYIQHDDKKVDALFVAMTRTSDQAERVRLGRELERYLSIESWLAWNIMIERRWVAYRDYVKGWPSPKSSPQSNSDYATTWLDK
ncbi:MAG: ABC transporter substrate-binding protein [Chloroflexi bacterium]|nr:ABC transporter substrate-binding protein [Chloroflexota bacterium]